MKKVDFIVVGQGLAGSLLAHDLLELGKSVLIIDQHLPASASKVAAGLFNPVGMKRCIPSNNASVYLPHCIQRFQQLEKKLSLSFLNITPIFRLFSNPDVRSMWQVKYSNEGMDEFISDFSPSNLYPSLQDGFGGANISPAGFLEVNKFLESSREYFSTRELLIEEVFDFEALDPEQATYKDIQAEAVVFCEGYRAIHNPYFDWLPLTPTKGEVMTIKIPSEKKLDKIVSKGIYLLPLGDYRYLVGATYNHTDFDDLITDEGQSFLLDKLNDVLEVDFEVIYSRAGVRPTVKDRKTLVGLHPMLPKLAVFNGLGTRGVLQGPYLSTQFSAFLTTKSKKIELTDNERIKRIFDKINGTF
jgi:glycine oxidase